MSKIAIVREILKKDPAASISKLSRLSNCPRPNIHVVVAKARKELGLKSRREILNERFAKTKAKIESLSTIKAVPELKEDVSDLLVNLVPHEPKADMVNHPPHYKSGGIETIDFIEAKNLNYNLGNVVKYVTRADLKGARKQDLEKALWYLQRELSAA